MFVTKQGHKFTRGIFTPMTQEVTERSTLELTYQFNPKNHPVTPDLGREKLESIGFFLDASGPRGEGPRVSLYGFGTVLKGTSAASVQTPTDCWGL